MSATPEQLLTNGLRVLMTAQCNYNCYFCHNEGLDKKHTQGQPIDPNMVLSFIKAGTRNLTLSGGEPLICFPAVCELLTRLTEDLPEDVLQALDVTLVSNGSLLDSEKTACLKAVSTRFKHLKINVSLHAANERTYDQVTQITHKFEEVKKNIRAAIQQGLDVRLNYVLLKDMNATNADIEAMLLLAQELDVKRIKLIEFLVTEQNKEFFSSLVRIDSLLYNFKHRAARIESPGPRTTRYLLQPEGISLDFVRCTCALGCRKCPEMREIELLPGNLLMPCMAKQQWAFDALGQDPLALAGKALGQIEKMEAVFGEYSPSLAFPVETVAAKAIFPVSAPPSSSELHDAHDIQRFRRQYELRWFLSPAELLLRPDYQFVCEHTDGDGHSRLLCFKEKTVREGHHSWNEIAYMDPVYDFSRTRTDVNERKASCMGYVTSRTDKIKEDVVVLPVSSKAPLKAYYCERRLANEAPIERRLEICLMKTEQWPEGEPLRTAVLLAAEQGLEIQPFETPDDVAGRIVGDMLVKYATLFSEIKDFCAKENDEGHQVDHALRVARNLFAIAAEEAINIAPDTGFLAALLHDLVRSGDGDHSTASAREAFRFLNAAGLGEEACDTLCAIIKKHSHRFVHQPELSTEQRLIQDADFLDCFSLEMIPRTYLFSNKPRAHRTVQEHLTEKCLKAPYSDFHFESTRRRALPGWLLLKAYLIQLDKNIAGIPANPAFLLASPC